MINELIND